MMYKSKNNPPRIAAWLLRKFLPESDVHLLMGDFEEDFKDRLAEKGRVNASLWYWRQVAISIPSFISYFTQRSAGMLKNYVKIAFRNLLKNLGYGFINVSGLAIGVTFCIVAYFFVKSEYTHDSFHDNAKNKFLVGVNKTEDDSKGLFSGTPVPLADYLKNNFSEIKNATTLYKKRLLIKPTNEVFEEEVFFVKNSFFNLFSFPLKKGKVETAFGKVRSILLSEMMVEKHFEGTEPIGRQILLNIGKGYKEYEVTGILKSIPSNSSIRPHFVIPFENLEIIQHPLALYSWSNLGFLTFIETNSSIYTELLIDKLPNLKDTKVIDPEKPYAYVGELTGDLGLTRLTDLHYDRNVELLFLKAQLNPLYSFVLGIIATVILFVACVNFMNLTLGQSLKRTNEVGIRKVFGAKRSQLIKQFFGETLILTIISVFLGVIIAKLFIPVFNTLIFENIVVEYSSNVHRLVFLSGIALLTALIAGSYPALVLSGVHAPKVLKSIAGLKNKNLFSSSLIAIQFSLSTILVITALSMNKQIEFLNNKDLGLDAQDLLVLRSQRPFDSELTRKIINRLKENENVINVSASRGSAFSANTWDHVIDGKLMGVPYITVDSEFLATYNIDLLAGDNFSENVQENSGKILVNESFLKQFNINFPSTSQMPQGFTMGQTILGVVRDFHFENFGSPIRPLILDSYNTQAERLSVKIVSSNIRETKRNIAETLNEMAPENPFSITFFNEQVQLQYETQNTWATVIGVATAFALFIASIGLAALASLEATRRTKEVGVRKALGASVFQIIRLFIKEFSLYLLIANIVALPVAYVIVNVWLEVFAYRVPIGANVFLLTGILILCLALIIISLQVLKAAISKPITSLRYE